MTSLPLRFIRNTLSNYSSAIASIVVALGVTPLLVRGLGKEAYAVLGLATASVLYFDLLKLGLGRAAVKYVAAARARGDEDAVLRTITTSTYTLMIPALFVVVITPLLAFVFPIVFDVPDELVTSARVIVVLSAVDLAIAIPGDTFGATLAGFQRYDFMNLTLVATMVSQAAAWAVVIALGGGLIGIGVATLAFSALGQTARYLFVRRLVGAPLLRRRNVDRTLVRPMLSMSGWMAVSDVADTVIARVDAFIVGVVAGLPQVATYLVGQKLAAFAARFTTPMTEVFYPHAATLAAHDDRSSLQQTLYLGTRISLAVTCPLVLCIGVLAEPTLNAWVGTGFHDAAPVVIFLSLTVLVSTVSKTAVYVLRGMGNVKVPAYMNIGEALVNLPLSIVLGLQIGFKGVALGTLLATAIFGLGTMLPYACTQIGASLRTLVRVAVLPNVLPSAAAFALGMFLLDTGIDGLLDVIAAGLAMLTVYVAAMLATGVSGTERTRLLAALVRRMPRARPS